VVGHQLEADMVESKQTIENIKKFDAGIMNRKQYVDFKLHQKNFCLLGCLDFRCMHNDKIANHTSPAFKKTTTYL
jgi:hypothetical protein